MKLVYLIVFLGISSAFAAPQRKTVFSVQNHSHAKDELQTRKQLPGIVEIIQAIVGLLTNILGVLDGRSSIQDLVAAIQNVFFTAESMFNVQWVVTQVPFIGNFLAPMVGGIGTIMADSSMLGGLLSQILIGPTYPKSIPLPPPTSPPAVAGNNGGWFGGWQ